MISLEGENTLLALFIQFSFGRLYLNGHLCYFNVHIERRNADARTVRANLKYSRAISLRVEPWYHKVKT